MIFVTCGDNFTSTATQYFHQTEAREFSETITICAAACYEGHEEIIFEPDAPDWQEAKKSIIKSIDLKVDGPRVKGMRLVPTYSRCFFQSKRRRGITRTSTKMPEGKARPWSRYHSRAA